MEDKEIQPKIEESVENPFENHKQNTDVLIRVQGYRLYLHSDIISQFSSELEKLLTTVTTEYGDIKEIVLTEEKAVYVIEIFKLLYPDTQAVLNEQTHYDELLFLSSKYQITVLTERIHDYLTKTHYQNTSKDSTKNIGGLKLVDKYNLEKLREKLLGFNYYDTFDFLQTLKEFGGLKDETIYELTKIRLSRKIYKHRNECNAILSLHDKMFYRERNEDRLDNIDGSVGSKSKRKKEIIKEKFDNYTEIKKIENIDNPFEEAKDKSDIVLIVGDYSLHLHSTILRHNSPVFKALLIGKKFDKESIENWQVMRDKRPEDIIDLFTYIYEGRFTKFKEDAKFDHLLLLCSEYQIKWLMDRIEEHLTENVFLKKQDDRSSVWGLHLADRFNLMNLRSKLLTFEYSSYSQLETFNGFEFVLQDTKFILATSRLKEIFPKDEIKKRGEIEKVESPEYTAIAKFYEKVLHPQ